MLRKPFADLGMPMRGIVVDDRVDRLSLGNVRVDLIEEADEFLMPMALHVAADNGAVENIERGEQRGRAVALGIVRQLECPDTMRRELVGLEDALHRPQADPYRLGQHPSCPMSGFSRRWPGHE